MGLTIEYRQKRRREADSLNREPKMPFRPVGDDGKRIWWLEKKKTDEDVTKGNMNGRNWLDLLPIDIMNLIFIKLGTIWLLGVAQHVCQLWRKLSKQPILYRSIAFHYRDVERFDVLFNNFFSVGGLARLAFDRSHGQTQQFYCSDTPEFYFDQLEHIANNPSSAVSLKSLRLSKFDYIDGLTPVIKKFTSLEELSIFHGWHWRGIPQDKIVEIGQACTKLRYLRIGKLDFSCNNMMAFAIAENMSGLRRLHVKGNSLTVEGFQAILNGCPRLEYLRLKGNHNLSGVVLGSLKKQFPGRINNIRVITKREFEFDLKKLGRGKFHWSHH